MRNSILSQEWDDYQWRESDQHGIFSADDGEEDGEELLREIDALYQPLEVTADRQKYFTDLVFWLRAEHR